MVIDVRHNEIHRFLVIVNVLRAQPNKQSVFVLMVAVSVTWHLVEVSVAMTFDVAVTA